MSKSRRAPPRETNPVVALVLGALLGSLGGAALAIWEGVVIAYLGLRLPDEGLGQQLVVTYAAAGAACGGVGGFLKLVGGRWAAFTGVLGLGWVLAGAATLEAERLGMPAVLVLAAGVAASLAAAMVVVKTIPSEHLLTGMGAFLATLVAIGAPINLHLLTVSVVGAGLMVNIAAMLAATVVGSAVSLVAGDGRGVRLPLVILLVGGVGLALLMPRLQAPEVTWPQAVYDDRPPVVMIVVGGARADHVIGGGRYIVAMPRVARFARRAWVYEDAMAPAPWTLPSMASVFTCRIPSRHGAGVNDGTGALASSLPADVPSIADRLALQGYATAAFVSSEWLGESYGFAPAFGVYDDDPGPASMPAVVFPLWAAGFEPYGWHRIRDAEELTDKALSFVLAQEKRAWFMMVHYADALGPYLTAADREAAGLSSTPGRAEAYPVALAKIDHNIDRLLSALPRDAIVVVMGDHGVQLDESRRQVGDAATGLWYGHTMYQELLHVPLVIHVPGSEGGRVTRPVSTLDVMPTLLGLAHVQHDLQLEGAPLVELSGGEVDRSRVLLAEGIRWGAEQQAARSGKHKAIARAGAKVSLFDLEDDPNESRPLIWSDGENQMVQKRLQAAMPHVGASRMGSEAPTMAQELGELLDRIAGAPR